MSQVAFIYPRHKDALSYIKKYNELKHFKPTPIVWGPTWLQTTSK